MKRSTFDVLFYVKRQAPLRDGTLPIMGKITVKTTQIYAKVTEKKSNCDMDLLESRLSQTADFQGLAVGQ